MYRCHVCADVSQPAQDMLRHTVYRPNGDTAAEVPVCRTCHRDLRTMPLADLVAAHTMSRVAQLEGRRLRRAARKRAEREFLAIGRALHAGRGVMDRPALAVPHVPATAERFPPAGVAPKRRALAL